MDRVEVDDLPNNILPLDALDALSRYELRTKLHQGDGSVVEGPSTPVPPHALSRVDGGLVVDPLRCPVGCQFKLRFPTIAGCKRANQKRVKWSRLYACQLSSKAFSDWSLR